MVQVDCMARSRLMSSRCKFVRLASAAHWLDGIRCKAGALQVVVADPTHARPNVAAVLAALSVGGPARCAHAGSCAAEPSSRATVSVAPAQQLNFWRPIAAAPGLTGGHVINQQSAKDALAAYPGRMQAGRGWAGLNRPTGWGGITPENAEEWLTAGASNVIMTSYVIREGNLAMDRLEALARLVSKDKLVLDLSCRKRGER